MMKDKLIVVEHQVDGTRLIIYIWASKANFEIPACAHIYVYL